MTILIFDAFTGCGDHGTAIHAARPVVNIGCERIEMDVIDQQPGQYTTKTNQQTDRENDFRECPYGMFVERFGQSPDQSATP